MMTSKMLQIENTCKLIKSIIPLKEVAVHSSGASAFSKIIRERSFSDGKILIPNYCCARIPVALLATNPRFCLVTIHSPFEVVPKLKDYKSCLAVRTGAMLMVHPWGCVHQYLMEIIARAKRINLLIIEDIASAFVRTCNPQIKQF